MSRATIKSLPTWLAGCRTDKKMSALLMQLARIQQIITAWLDSAPDKDTYPFGPVGGLVGFDKLLSFADQVRQCPGLEKVGQCPYASCHHIVSLP